MKKWRYRLLYGIINVQPRRSVTNSVGLTDNDRSPFVEMGNHSLKGVFA